MHEDTIIRILEEDKLGKTITELVKETCCSRSSIRTILARLEGAEKVNIRKIGMAKVYVLNQNGTINQKTSGTDLVMKNNKSYEPSAEQLGKTP